MAATLGARYVVGIEREAKVLKTNVEGYVRNIVSRIAASKLSEPLRTSICASVDTIVYRGHSVVCLWVPPQKSPSDVGDQLFIRSGSETKRVEGRKQTQAILELFQQ